MGRQGEGAARISREHGVNGRGEMFLEDRGLLSQIEIFLSSFAAWNDRSVVWAGTSQNDSTRRRGTHPECQ